MDKVSVEDIVSIVENEGLGYAVGEYLDAESIKDKTLAKLWGQAQDALDEVEHYLTAYFKIKLIKER